MLTKKQAVLARHYAKGGIEVQEIDGPVEYGFERRFLLYIGGAPVAPVSMPNQGYRSRREARADGAAFKAACRKALRPSRF